MNEWMMTAMNAWWLMISKDAPDHNETNNMCESVMLYPFIETI